ncbi:MAG: hypothetical protein AAF702_35735 [Chloroflexota bacterium]
MNIQPLSELREILVSPEQDQIALLTKDVASLQEFTDKERLTKRMVSVVTQVIEKQIRESPKEVIELLYPLLGGMVKKFVQEAISNLARQIDAQRRRVLNFRHIFDRFRVDSEGTSWGALALRDALPFSVEELFIIHRESGLLIHHESLDSESLYDSDIISAMLTAIGDFVRDTFGKNLEGELKEVEYGDKRVLIEDFNYVYVATVVDGIEPFDYRHEIRRRVSAFERENRKWLINYAGDPTILTIHVESLRRLFLAE